MNKGKFPIDKHELNHYIKKAIRFEFPEEITKAKSGIMKVISDLLKYLPEKRASPDEVLKSKYFDGVANKIRRDLNIRAMK